ncbi:MAG: molybdopterin-guanine dinucleotide biosynthesis protein [Arthrobacter sp.]|nr:molybdopterin-guanine dinucleotide biosynthesis protein [Arthrobacter sp.]MCU1541334.1 molybdopterin-guanine dinucleotide biosynthesis protein [Arthrobacter sp.]MCU1555659.1 molybdopterin-guanine dinucleotide biosynthesis protein [Arthrobacter sp.]
MEFDAVILAGGRSSRLGGAPKSRLVSGGRTLLELSLQAAHGAGTIVVVGPDPGPLPAGVLTCREEPPFAGPAAAIGAGLGALAAHRSAGGMDRPTPALTLVLACDMPRVTAAVTALREALETGLEGDGVLAVSADGRRQPLAGFYGTAALQRSVAEAARRGALENASVSALLASLDVRGLGVPPGSTDDVDTWDDAAALGVSGQGPDERSGAPRLNPTLEENGEEPG